MDVWTVAPLPHQPHLEFRLPCGPPRHRVAWPDQRCCWCGGDIRCAACHSNWMADASSAFRSHRGPDALPGRCAPCTDCRLALSLVGGTKVTASGGHHLGGVALRVALAPDHHGPWVRGCMATLATPRRRCVVLLESAGQARATVC